MTDHEGDLPKTVAVIIATIPGLVLRTGFVYLRTKRMARRNAKRVMKGMVDNGIPPELAKELAFQYDDQLRVRTLVRTFVPGPWMNPPGRP